MTEQPYRILVTGSRDWTDQDAIWEALGNTVAPIPIDREIVIVHGHCPRGADALADEWGRKYGATLERHPANWHLEGKRAGFIRNARMVNRGADVVLAFVGPCTSPRCRRTDPHPSHGASGCADLAEEAGIPVKRWTA